MLKKSLIGIKEKFKDNINYIYINVYMQNQLKMKEIVSVIKITQVELSKIEDNHHVGILWCDGKKSKVIQSSDGFMGFSLLDYDLRSRWTRKSKNKYVEDALEQTGTRAYLFDSKEGLLEWLLEN